jgi:hypothetical protein
MMPSRGCVLAFAAALAGSLPGWAMANDRDLKATTVPAALCVEGRSNGAPLGGLWLNEREYGLPGRLDSDFENADQRLHCALPVNNIDLGGTTNDNDISSFTVFYRDGDGVAPNTFVEVTLYQTMLASGTMQTRAVCSWNSNTSGTSSTGYVGASVPCVHDVAATALYHFGVRMFTTTVTNDIVAAFVGIRFP